MSLNSLKSDMLKIIDLSAEIGKYNEQLLHHSNMADKHNYNKEKCERIQCIVRQLKEEFYFLKEKWFL